MPVCHHAPLPKARKIGVTSKLRDERTKGIQPSIIKDIGRAIACLLGLGEMAIVLVEQYLDFARELGDHFAVMDRGQIVYSASDAGMEEGGLKRVLAI
jgi:urea transport system ATP-binding protein